MVPKPSRRQARKDYFLATRKLKMLDDRIGARTAASSMPEVVVMSQAEVAELLALMADKEAAERALIGDPVIPEPRDRLAESGR